MTLAAPPLTPEAPRVMLRAVARGGLAGLAGAAFTGVAGVAVTWLVARGLSPVDAGAFFTAAAAFGVGVTVAKLGAQTSMVYWPARLRAAGAPEDDLRACLRTGLRPVVGTALLVCAVLWLASGVVAGPLAGPLRALALFVPAAAISDAMLAATRGYRVIRPTVVLDRFLRPALQCGLLAVLLLVAPAPWWYAAAWAGPFIPAALLGGYALTRLGRRDARLSENAVEGRPANVAPRSFDSREFWAFTGPRAVASVAQVALQRLDIVLVAVFAGLAPAALYAVAGRFVVLGQFVNGALAQSVQPRLAERLSTGDTDGAGTLYRQATAWLVLATWPMYLLVASYAPVYLGFFGRGYVDGVPVVLVLAGAMLVATACGTVDMVLAMGGRTWWNLANVAIALAVLLLVNNLVPLAQVRRALGIHPFGRSTVSAMSLAIGCFGVPALLVWLFEPSTALRLTTTAAGTVAYLLAAVRMKDQLTLGGS